MDASLELQTAWYRPTIYRVPFQLGQERKRPASDVEVQYGCLVTRMFQANVGARSKGQTKGDTSIVLNALGSMGTPRVFWEDREL